MIITQIWNGWLLKKREWSKDSTEFYGTLEEVVCRIKDLEWTAPVLRAIDDGPCGSCE